ncbi:MAG: tyrosine-protein phosphatase [Atopobiaceae bacterium]|nr:tyrosine-protein phosphatase [Atopobiaceae bacterium]
MVDSAQVFVRLPLEGLVNARDLGGYPTSDGRTIRFGRFLRTDELWRLTDADIEFLKAFNVHTVIDLRDEEENLVRPDRYTDEPGVSYHNYPLFRGNAADTEWAERQRERTLIDMYMRAIHNKPMLRGIFHTIAHADEGCVLFHCAVGKDRTGIVAALLMLIAGCDRQDCVACYMQSHAHLMRTDWYRIRWASGEERARMFLDSHPRTISAVLDVVEEAGGVEDFLLDCGVTVQEIRVIRSRLLDEDPIRI